MSIASVSSSSSYGEQRFYKFQPYSSEQQQQQQQLQRRRNHHRHEQLVVESIDWYKERVVDSSLRVEVLECQIREEVEKLVALVGSSSCLGDGNVDTSSSSSSSRCRYHANDDDDGNSSSENKKCIHQLKARIHQLENDLIIEQRTLAKHQELYQVTLERTKQRWKQQIEEHQRRFRVCYRAVPPDGAAMMLSRTKSS